MSENNNSSGSLGSLGASSQKPESDQINQLKAGFGELSAIEPNHTNLISSHKPQHSSSNSSDSQKDFGQLQGEFKIERGFSGLDRAQQFAVTNPITTHKDFVVYTVIGLLRKEQFEI